MTNKIDPIQLEIVWTRLMSMVDEASVALERTAFSEPVRDGKDYACSLCDAEYNLIAQGTLGSPGFVGIIPGLIKNIGQAYPPETLREGDVLITNDPWIVCGHSSDIAVVTPIFSHGKLTAYAASVAHHIDIGGRTMTQETRDVFEEGLFIPILKLYEGGQANETVFEIIQANVRVPDYVVGDLRAQLAANDVMARSLLNLMEEYGMADIREFSHEILARTETAVRDNIRQFPDGVCRNEAFIDKFDDQPIKIAVEITLNNGDIVVDYTGSSPQINRAVNVCFNYTFAETALAMKCALSSSVPNNEGGLRPLKVIAPEGSILNARFPAPVNSRLAVVFFLPEIIFGALAQLMPDRVMAGCGSSPMWSFRATGQWLGGRQFLSMHFCRGGIGARPSSDGISTLAFPGNAAIIPAEIAEGNGPLIIEKRGLRTDSAGAGKYRGGLGHHEIIRVLSGDRAPTGLVTANIRAGRFHYPVPGLLGGHNGPNGVVIADGETFTNSSKQFNLKPGGYVELLTPGGGGYGDPLERDPVLIEKDVRYGFVSPEAAKDSYGIVMDESGWNVDMEASEKLRAARRKSD